VFSYFGDPWSALDPPFIKSLARNVVLESSSAEVSILTCVLMYVFSLWAQEIRQAAQSDTFSSMWLAQPETQ